MVPGSKSRSLLFLFGFLPFTLCCFSPPLKAASALAAWSLGRNGVLQLRTSVDADLEAFFQEGSQGKGARVWIDFPGELSHPRKIKGNGPVSEIRLGKPAKGITRLVLEFQPNVKIQSRKLKLIGISKDRWELSLIGIKTNGIKPIGEGSMIKYNSPSYLKNNFSYSKYDSLNFSSLPNFPLGKYIVVIDPGHGGPDSGAVGRTGLRETDVVLDISLNVAKLLRSKGITVRLTRTSETDLDLPPRVAIANRLRADAFISIHANAARNPRKDVNGIETFYFSGSRGWKLSSFLQKEVLKVSPGSPDRGVRRGRFFVIRRTNMPAALVETGFLNGRIDGPRLSKSSHRKKLAFAISKAIINYLKWLS